jgi:PilZ domain
MERRRAVRYDLRAAAVFSWEGPEGTPLKGEGITRDIGRGGVFVFSAICPAVNSFVRLRVLLHQIEGRMHEVDGRTLDIDVDGTVLRVEHFLEDSTSSGFALAATKFSLDVDAEDGSDS